MSEVTQNKRKEPAIPNGVVGIIFFIASETMLFAALISSYMILRAGVPVWPPWGQPPLPIGITWVNTGILLISGYFLLKSKKVYTAKGDQQKVKSYFRLAMFLGTFFVALQGYEWVQLIGKGLTLTSSTYGGLFYLIIGMHGFHALCAILGIHYVYRRIDEDDYKATRNRISTISLFWMFVVLLWPVLFGILYLW